MTLLVTGSCGYIASHTVDYLKQSGFEDIVGIDNLEVGSMDNSRCTTVVADIRNTRELNAIFEDYNIDAVMHFAALTSVPESMKKREDYFEVNAEGTENLLNVMMNHGCSKLIFSSTASIYMQSKNPVKETDAIQPLNNYALTKLYAEKLIKKAARMDWLSAVIFRYFNVVGYADWYNYMRELNKTNIVPTLINSVKCHDSEDSTKFKVFGNCYPTERLDKNDHTCVRDYIDVRDIAKAHLLAYTYLNTYKGADTFNLGTKTGSSVLELIRAFEVANKVEIPYEIVAPRNGDPACVVADNRRAKELLGWQPDYTLEQSLLIPDLK